MSVPSLALPRRPLGAFVVALVAAVAVGWLTGLRGIGLDNDSAHYIAAGESWVEGRGWRGVDDQPFTLWPPGYPTLYGLLRLAGLARDPALRLLVAASVAVTSACVGLLATTHPAATARPRLAGVLGAVAGALACFPTFSSAWSEAPFNALVCASALAATRSWSSSARGAWWSCVALALAATAVRYVGALWIMAVCGALLLDRELVARWRRALSLATAGVALLGLWSLRNRWVAGALDGPRGPASNDWNHDLASAARALVPVGEGPAEWSACLGVVLLVGLGAWRARAGGAQRVWTLFPLIYAPALVVLRHCVEFDTIGARLMSPTYPFLAVLAVGGVLTALERAPKIALPLLATWGALACAPRAVKAVSVEYQRARNGPLGVYDAATWRHSPTLAWVAEHAPVGELWSNDPFAVFLVAGRRCRALPARPAGFSKLAARWAADPAPDWVVWFELNARAVFPRAALGEAVELEERARAADGVVFAVSEDSSH